MRSTLGSSAAVGGLVLLCLGSVVAAQAPLQVQPITHVASVEPGAIEGTVLDERGAPVVGAMVSAFGATSVVTVSDRAGRFEMRTLSPGPYVVRAHLAGFVASSLRLLTHERLRRTMGRRGRRVARERFSVDEMVDRYIRVYDSLR